MDLKTQDSRLAELRKSISEMSDDELHELIGQSRNNRHAAPIKKARVKPTKSKKPDPAEDLMKSLETLSLEEQAVLLKKLQSQSGD